MLNKAQVVAMLALGVLFQAGTAQDPENSGRGADSAAIRKLSSEFTEALGKGDAKAVAGYWTKEGEYIGHDGTTLRGQAAMEEAYAKFFKATTQPKVEMNIDSIRFVSQDTAIEEGHAKAERASLPTSNRYSI